MRHRGLLDTVAMFVFVLWLLQSPAFAFDRSHATTFATLPQGSAHPEGITTDSKGNFYVVTWDYERPGKLGHLIVFAPDGKFQRRVEIAGSSNRLGDISFQPETGNLLVVDYGGKQVLKVDPVTGASSVFITIPGEKPEPPSPRTAWAAPNGMTFDKKGNIYLTDSFQGTVWKTGPTGGAATPWVKSELLISHGFPSLGANGLAFDRAGNTLFVGNTGDDTIVRIPVVNGEAGKPEVFINSVNGPDGMFVDEDDRLWVVANQSDEIYFKGMAQTGISQWAGQVKVSTSYGYPLGFHRSPGEELGWAGHIFRALRRSRPGGRIQSPAAKTSVWRLP